MIYSSHGMCVWSKKSKIEDNYGAFITRNWVKVGLHILILHISVYLVYEIRECVFLCVYENFSEIFFLNFYARNERVLNEQLFNFY